MNFMPSFGGQEKNINSAPDLAVEKVVEKKEEPKMSRRSILRAGAIALLGGSLLASNEASAQTVLEDQITASKKFDMKSEDFKRRLTELGVMNQTLVITFEQRRFIFRFKDKNGKDRVGVRFPKKALTFEEAVDELDIETVINGIVDGFKTKTSESEGKYAGTERSDSNAKLLNSFGIRFKD
jgi:hypothetical protein